MACATFEELFRTYEDRPPKLLELMGKAYLHPLFHPLSQEMRSILVALLSRLPQYRLHATFKARADRCAAEVGVCRKTVTRAITRFIQEGWVARVEEGRTGAGRFGATAYAFTPALLSALGVTSTAKAQHIEPLAPIAEIQPKGPVPEDRVEEGTEVSHGFLYVDVHFKEDHQAISADLSPKPTDPKPDVTPSINPLPADVAILGVEYSVHPLAVYALMGQATAAGHRLADLVVIAKPYLDKIKATGYRAFRYIQSMFRKGKGYAKKAQSQRDVQEDQTRQQTVAAASKRYEGGVFEGRNGERVEVRGGAALYAWPDGKTSALSGSFALKAYEDIEMGYLRPVSIAKPTASPQHYLDGMMKLLRRTA